MQFKTQFSDGFKYDDAAGIKTKLSAFMAPAYINVAIGMNYTPSKIFNLFIGPLSGKSTIVLDKDLTAASSFGVDSAKRIRNEFGGSMKALLNVEIMKNVTLNSKLEMFSNYIKNPQNIDIDWLLLINMKVNKFLSTSIILNMLYDDDIKTFEGGVVHGAKVQFKEVFGVGLNFKF